MKNRDVQIGLSSCAKLLLTALGWCYGCMLSISNPDKLSHSQSDGAVLVLFIFRIFLQSTLNFFIHSNKIDHYFCAVTPCKYNCFSNQQSKMDLQSHTQNDSFLTQDYKCHQNEAPYFTVL